ncbi:MAG: sialate O-acetylesterase [Bacteroidota bacterium]
MKKFSLLLFTLLTAVSFAQVSVTSFPKNNQLFPRNRTTNQSVLTLSGSVDHSGISYTDLRVKLFRNGAIFNTYDLTLNFTADIAPFNFTFPINAELANYTIELYGVNGYYETLVQRAADVVSGDAYIINGQSNAVANMYSGSSSAQLSPFIRSFGTSMPDASVSSDNNWYVANGDAIYAPGAIGQWGLKTARWIVDNMKVPVAVINGAVGGTSIDQHQRYAANPYDLGTIYGRLLHRVTAAGLKNSIRAVWWHQGESDAILGRTGAAYSALFTSLKASWQLDFPTTERYFTFQIRQGCGNNPNNVLAIMEAQRQLAKGNVHIVSTNGANQNTDNCHFPYAQGYELFADRLIKQVQVYLYGAVSPQDMNAPEILTAKLVAYNLIELTFTNITSLTMFCDPTAGADFKLEGAGAGTAVLTGVALSNKIYLALSGAPKLPSTISYVGHQGSGMPFLRTLGGNAALSFASVPVTSAPLLGFMVKQEDTELNQAIQILEEQAPELATSIRESIRNNQDFTVSPNPASSVSSITLPSDGEWKSVTLSDITGRTVLYSEFKNGELTAGRAELDLSSLPSGQYFVQLSGDRSVAASKLVVQR